MNHENIPIKNIYYMISYAYKSLKFEEMNGISTESFKNTAELYAEILILSVNKLLKKGLWKEYKEIHENSSFIKGKIDVHNSIKPDRLLKRKVAVQYEVMSDDNLLNQIIKSTVLKLVLYHSLPSAQHRHLKEILLYMSDINVIDLNMNVWSQVKYNSQNSNYRLPIDICHYLYLELLINDDNKDSLMKGVNEEQALSSLYEKFVFEFYRKETDFEVSKPQIRWNVDDEYSAALPVMQTDIVLKKNGRTIIIDTKFYSNNMARRTIESDYKHLTNNLYQMFSYLENYQPDPGGTVSGILLYARTRDEIQPNHSYRIKGKNIHILNLDLSQTFSEIEKSLLEIVTN